MTLRPLFLLCSLLLAGTVEVGAAESIHRLRRPADLARLTLRPGDTVLLPDGDWTDQNLQFRGRGTIDRPITLRAEHPGKFQLSGRSHLVVDGDWLVVEGVLLRGGGPDGEGITLRGSHHRLTQSAVIGGTYKFFVRLFGTRHLVDHCFFAGKTSGDPTFQVEVAAEEPNYHRIEANHFGPRAPLGRNGGETIRIGYSGQSMNNSRTTVEGNLFERCDGEIEIISNKSCENTYRGNTFRDCDGMLTLRHGNRCVVDANIFLGGDRPHSGGIRIIGEDHVVTNNYIAGVRRGAFWVTSGVPDSALNQYYVAKRALIAFNTVVESSGPMVDQSAGLGGSGRTLRPVEITVANNLFVLGARAVLRQGEPGEGWRWIGNQVEGKVEEPPPGVAVRAAQLVRDPAGLLRPQEGPEAIARAESEWPKVTTDLDGQPRPAAGGDVGCDQRSAGGTDRRPLTAKDVGPGWLGGR